MNKNLYTINQPWLFFSISINTLIKNPVILYPFSILAFIQLLALEILYFAPRYPFVKFFAPLISTIWSKKFLHYPFDLVLLPKIFYYAQLIIYFFLGNFCLAVAASLISAINSSQKGNLKIAIKNALSKYVHLCFYSIISFFLFFMINKFFLLIANITMMTSEPINTNSIYIQFILSTIITVSLAYVIPIIACEKKKIFSALFLNFKTLYSSFWQTLIIVTIPTFFYLPIYILRNQIDILNNVAIPEVQLFFLIINILITVVIDTIVITALTNYYLIYKKTQ